MGPGRLVERVNGPGFRSGFVSVVGRPNVGKSTLVNRLVGTKVSIVSARPQTTRSQVRGVRTTDRSQLVLLDTPGVHRPRTLLGERTNERAVRTLGEVDAVCQVVDATGAIGPGDRHVARLVHDVRTPRVLVVNKIDAARPDAIARQLAGADELLGSYDAYVPLSARSGEGCAELVGELEARMPLGPLYYPDGVVTDQPEAVLAAELVREQLLARTRDELPHSIAVTAVAVDASGEERSLGRARAIGPPEERPDDILRFEVVIRVERESQKGIVIGRGGCVLRDAGTAARRELEALLGARVFLSTRVRVEPAWPRRARTLDRLGL